MQADINSDIKWLVHIRESRWVTNVEAFSGEIRQILPGACALYQGLPREILVLL